MLRKRGLLPRKVLGKDQMELESEEEASLEPELPLQDCLGR